MSTRGDFYSNKFSALGGVSYVGNARAVPDERFKDEVKRLETMIGGMFPPAYVEFVEQYGFVSSNELWVVSGTDKIPGTDEDNSVFVGCFFGVVSEKRNHRFSVEHMLDIYEDQLPKGYVPICDGGWGDLFCQSVNKPNYGKIYYWCHEEPEDHNLFLVADTFNEFIEKLEVDIFDPIQPQPKVVAIKVTAKGLEMLENFRKGGSGNSNGDTIRQE